jgi:hypothetical protein
MHAAAGRMLTHPLLANAPIQQSAWKGNSQKSVRRMPHSPARWLPYSRPETSRLLKVDHDMLHLRRLMRSGAYASSRQDTDYAGAGDGQELRPRVHYERYGLPDIGVCTRRFEGRYIWSGLQGRRGPTPRLQRRSRQLWRAMVEVSGSGAARRTIFCRNVR